jgi:hypothetical protein
MLFSNGICGFSICFCILSILKINMKFLQMTFYMHVLSVCHPLGIYSGSKSNHVLLYLEFDIIQFIVTLFKTFIYIINPLKEFLDLVLNHFTLFNDIVLHLTNCVPHTFSAFKGIFSFLFCVFTVICSILSNLVAILFKVIV